jgi:hypothetical protein
MPAAIPLVAAAAGYAASAAGIGEAIFGVTLLNAGLGFSVGGAIAFENSIAGFLVSTALNAVGSRAFAPHSSQPADLNANPQSRATMVNSTVETHKIVYGEAKVSGPVVYIGTTDSGPIPHGGPATGKNIMLHLVVALAGHEVDSIGTVYFNDEPVTINSDGYVTNMPYSYYPDNPTANTQSVSTAVRTNEIVTVTTSSAHGFAAGDQVTTAITTDLSMNGDFIIIDIPSPTTFTYSNGGPNASATGGTATDNTISGTINSYARIKKHTGSASQTVDPDLLAEVPGWDIDHRLQGIAYVYVRLQYSQDVFAHGIPNISAIVRGKRVYDPRSQSIGYSKNVALCIRDYLTSDYGFNCQDTEINDNYFISAANICDEAVVLTTGGTQARYTANGSLDTATAPVENLNALVASMAGTVTYVQGQFRAHAGAYDPPVADLDPSMFAGKISIQTRPPRTELFNCVQGTYIDPSRSYAVTDFPPVTNSTYIANDGGTQIFKDIQLPLTNHPEAAQRISKVILEQGRQGIQLELTLNHNAMMLCAWDTVTYTDSTYGWDHKVFRVKKFSSAGIGPVVLSLQEESSASYNWNSGEATVIDAAPDTNLPDPLSVSVLQGVAFSSRASTTPSGDTIYNLVLAWTQHPDAFVVHGGLIEIQYKLSSDTDWRPSFFVDGALTFTDILTSAVNISYDLRARAINSLGVRSNWTELDHAIIGSSGGVGTTNDWGSVADAVGPTNDWGSAADPVGTTNDWGSVT